MRTLVLVLGLVLVLPGCSKILGIGDVSRGDGGVEPDSGAPPNTVIGRAYTRYRTPAGTTDVPRDLTAIIIRAMIPDTNEPTGFRVVEGTGKADGTFSISPVPDGIEYYLRIDRSYYVTSQHDVDYHIDFPMRGQPEPAIASAPSTLTFAVTNMQPFKENSFGGTNDTMSIDSFGLLYNGTGSAAHNAVAFDQAYDWSKGFSLIGNLTPLPDSSLGDDVWVSHLRQEYLPGSSGRKHATLTTLDVFNATNVTLTNGGSVAVTGAFTAVPADRSISLSFMRGAVESGFDPSTIALATNVALRANPIAADFSVGGLLVNVDFSDWSRSVSGTSTVTATYGDPFPASWARQLELSYIRSRYILVPGTTLARSVNGFLRRIVPYTGGNPPLTMTLTLPANVKIGGKPASAGGMLPFDGISPIAVSWSPVAGAKTYTVNIQRAYANGNQTRTQSMGSVTTAGTSVQIPAEALTGSEYYAFTVGASVTPSDYSAGQLVPNGSPNQFASTPTAMFRLSATCGNGAVDSGEQCDTTGESASCDVDCTAVVCGDGLRNAVAGEACDSIRDSDGCDSDCTAAMCGDGHINFATEDCDDGNTVDNANGCSSGCKFNNACGDGVTQAAAEQCDTGGDSATCDADCTLAECPDGHFNAGAGEQCDDGNFNETDGCTTTCMIN